MNPTYKVVLDKRHTTTNGMYSLKLRIYQGVQYKEKSLKIFISETDWDEKIQAVLSSHPEYKKYNADISSTIRKVQKAIYLSEDSNQRIISPDTLVKAVSSKPKSQIGVFKYGQDLIENLVKAGRVGSAIAYGCALSKLKKHVNSRHIHFEDITFKILDDFSNSMLAEGMTVNAIGVYFRQIRSLYNCAIKEGIVNSTSYPFSKYKIKTTKTISRALTVEEMRSIAQLKLRPNTPIWHSRNYFMLSFCLIGTNLTDLFKLTPDSIQNNRVVFSRSKTKKIYTIGIHPKVIEILSSYFKPENSPDYLLPLLTTEDSPMVVKKKAAQAIKTINKYMGVVAEACDIKQDVTSYYARYSWANIARRLGYSKDLIAEALGHDYGNRVTAIYLDCYENDVIDKANTAVISAVLQPVQKARKKK